MMMTMMMMMIMMMMMMKYLPADFFKIMEIYRNRKQRKGEQVHQRKNYKIPNNFDENDESY